MSDPVYFFVHGIPQPQGSMKAFVVNGRPILTSANRNVGDWRRLVAACAQQHAPNQEDGAYPSSAWKRSGWLRMPQDFGFLGIA